MKVSDEDLATLAVWNGLPKGATRCAPIVDRLVAELLALRAVADAAEPMRGSCITEKCTCAGGRLNSALKAAGR